MFVKLCGLRTPADVEVAVDAGADAIGFVFTTSPRQISPDAVRSLIQDVPPNVLTVGVVRGISASEAAPLAAAAGVDALQLHGDYSRSDFASLSDLRLVRATSLKPDTDVRTGAFGEEWLLLDSPVAGSGEQWDLTVLNSARPSGQWLLAGGLTPSNVAHAVRIASPWGVDVSSGVESSRGVKDHGLMREFVVAARA
jgi:phosphoribosylanthranilate isomerase